MIKKIFRRLYVKWCVYRGKAIDIWSKSAYPAGVLSNLHSNGFRFDGMDCGSMEGFLQSLKYKDVDKQRQICSMKGKNAKNMSVSDWQTDQIVWWKGKAIDRQSEEFLKLVDSAYQAMFEQNKNFRSALLSTRGITLYHTRGECNSFKTILTEQEFCSILTNMRKKYEINIEISQKLYKSLSESKFSGHNYRIDEYGENMRIIEESIDGWWKQRYLLDDENRCAYEIMNEGLRFVNFLSDDINWESLQILPKDVIRRAERLSALYPSFVRKFSNGVAQVSWQLNPDGRYYMDDDGFGMTDDEEITIYGFIDRQMNVVVKFKYINDDWEQLKQMRAEAEDIVKRQTQ